MSDNLIPVGGTPVSDLDLGPDEGLTSRSSHASGTTWAARRRAPNAAVASGCNS